MTTQERRRRIKRGDALPHVVVPPPGPLAKRFAERIRQVEAPGINTLDSDGGTAMVWQEACGSNVLDVDGNLYLDLTAGFGVASVGHRAESVVAAASAQSRLLVHGLGDVFSHPARIELAERLVALAPMPDARAYFAASGADAVEIALKTARLYTGRPGVLAFDPAYHGLTLGALRVSSRAAFREPFTPHDDPVQRAAFGADPGLLAQLLRQRSFGAVIVEPIIGREGVLLPPPGWLEELSTLCTRYGTLLIADEIFVGFGRTGPWFVSTEERCVPDLVCCGKALAGGFPLAAVLGRAEVLAAWQVEGEALHTATFVAHPVACAAALATLDLLSELLPAAPQRIAEGLEPLRELADQHGFSLRGRGGLWALAGERAKGLGMELLRRGVLALAGGPQGDVLQLTPPLVITDAQLAAVVDLTRDALEALAPG